MSYCKESGKDRIIFVTKEDHEKPSTVQLKEIEGEEKRGLILENGEINWNCPCLGGMASGPCGYQFREAFSCFHYSTSETKGSDCIEKFAQMQECMSQYPNLYPNRDDNDDDDDDQEFTNQQIDDNTIDQLQQQLAQTSEANQQSSVEKPGSVDDQNKS